MKRNLEIKNHIIKLLANRGVTIENMAHIVYELQYRFDNTLTLEYCIKTIDSILEKTEVQNAIMLGVQIDKAHERGHILNPYLNNMISTDEGCFGLDEAIGLNPANCYGTIALSNFGYLDVVKTGFIKELDNSKEQTNVFLDDLVCGICASACGKLAHNKKRRDLKNHIILTLQNRGVTIESMAEIVYKLQSPYNKTLTVEYCKEVIESVLEKTEVQNAIMLGIEIDILHERGLIDDPYLNKMITIDEGCFGLDETIGANPANCYGTIAFTNFGYLDKEKIGIIKELDNSKEQTNVFLDDLVCGICACACGKIAHNA